MVFNRRDHAYYLLIAFLFVSVRMNWDMLFFNLLQCYNLPTLLWGSSKCLTKLKFSNVQSEPFLKNFYRVPRLFRYHCVSPCNNFPCLLCYAIVPECMRCSVCGSLRVYRNNRLYDDISSTTVQPQNAAQWQAEENVCDCRIRRAEVSRCTVGLHMETRLTIDILTPDASFDVSFVCLLICMHEIAY